MPNPAKDVRHPECIRLDRTENPYGPSLAVFEALHRAEPWQQQNRPPIARLQREVAVLVGVPTSWILLGNGIDELLEAIFLMQRDHGPLVLFPPTSPGNDRRAALHRLPVIQLQRSPAFTLALDVDTVADLPPGSWAVVESPNDPTGTLVDAQDAVRLARATELVVIDERHGAYSRRSLVPFGREFENIIVLQTMETWAALSSFPIAYAIGPPPLLDRLRPYLAREDIAAGAMTAGLATLTDLSFVNATLHRVRHERSRLYRMLRKLNMVSPLATWSNFVPVRVERGAVPFFVAGLSDRGIRVYQPPQPELRRLLRISAGEPEHTDALKRALIEVALAL